MSVPAIAIDCIFISKQCSQAGRAMQSSTDAEHPHSALLWAGDDYSGLAAMWSCALGTRQGCVFQFQLTCRESPAVRAPRSAIQGEGVKFPSEAQKGRWWRRGAFCLTPTLIPSLPATAPLTLDLSFTFPAGWDLERFTPCPYGWKAAGRCLASS